MDGASVDAKTSPGHRISLVALRKAADIEGSGADVVDMKLEVVVLPVADEDRARRCVARRPRMASTRRRPGSPTRTGRTGTPSPWWTNSPTGQGRPPFQSAPLHS
jgi:hypothetical protein